MPYIEELANPTAHAAAPGWAYVPDTGYDPSKAAIVPSGTRSRHGKAGHGGTNSAAATAAASAKQQNRISKRLAALEKENHRDVVIAIPGRTKDASSRGLHGKITTGVRRILASEKNLAHHLADEEAAIANHQYHPIEQFPRSKPRSPLKTKSAFGQGSKKTSKATPKNVSASETIMLDDSGAQTHQDPPMGGDIGEQSQFDNSREILALFEKPIPALPSDEEIEALLSAPPLPYNEARAAPSASTAPPRQFCEMCGYWGRAKCMKCGVRVCGLDCKTQHDEMSCMKFYA